jgi:hypothetical protein
MADDNVQSENQLGVLTNEVEELYSTLREKKAAYDALVQRQNAIMHRYTPAAILKKMAAKVDEADNASEDIAEAFMGEEKTLEEFLAEYVY